jgi:hypothetical protein
MMVLRKGEFQAMMMQVRAGEACAVEGQEEKTILSLAASQKLNLAMPLHGTPCTFCGWRA